MATDPYRCLRIEVEAGVATVTLDHPPINLLDAALIAEMDRAGRELEADSEVKVVVIRSEDPDFFIAHADVELILQLPAPAEGAAPPERPSAFQAIVDRLFFRKEYDYGEIIDKISSAIASLMDLGEILKRLMQTFMEDMFINTGSVALLSPDGATFKVYIAGGDKEEVPESLEGAIVAAEGSSATVRAPDEPGAYRLFVYVHDGQGSAGHANIPFRVK